MTDFDAREQMIGEYEVLELYPKGHLMEFVRPTLAGHVLASVDVERLDDGAAVTVAGWPVARQHPRGRDGTVFVTIEDEFRRRADHFVGGCVCAVQPRAGQPGDRGERDDFEVGWDDECDRVVAAGDSGGGEDASSPRLALRRAVFW